MVSRRGISVLDLVLGFPAGDAAVLIPDDVRGALESLAVLEHTTTTTAAAYIHEGTAQALGDEPLALPGVSTWAIESPILTTGLRFRVVRTRTAAAGNQNVEPASVTNTVDLYLDPIGITFPRLVPAIVAGGTFGSANPAHLVPDPDRDGVRAWGRAILRITLGSPVTVSIVDWPDPFNPAATSGAVAELSMDPPSFLVGTTGFGGTIDRLVIDVDQAFTPADIVARGQDATWVGLSLREGTMYFPRGAPIVGDLSIGLHDLLIGMPPSDNGIQGEAVIEFGRTPVSPAIIDFEDVDGSIESDINAAGYTLVFLRNAVSEIKATLPPEAEGLPSDPTTAYWVLPDGTRREDTASTGWFVARAGESMRASFTEIVDGHAIPGEEEVFVFTLAATSPAAVLPTIDVRTAGATIEHVASVSGSNAALTGVTFAADPDDAAGLEWQLGDGAATQTATGPTFAPHFQLASGTHQLLLRSADGAVRRCEVSVLEQGALVVGSEAGPRAADGTDLGVRQLLATYDLATFDRDGRRVANGLDATLTDGVVTVPAGALAAVSAAIGTTADPDEPVPPDDVSNELRYVRVLMLFDAATATLDQFYRPDGTLVDAPTHVGEWAASFDGDVKFLVIGRCCDLGSGPEGDAYNDQLARDRAELAATWIDGPVFLRSEQQPIDPAGQPVQDDAVAAGLLDGEEIIAQRLITALHGQISGSDTTTPPRPEFRRADIYAVGGTPTDDTPEAHGELMPQPAQREALLPGDDAPDLAPSPRNPKLPFRTRLTVGWDSPSVHEPADAVPTLAELLLEWATTNLTIPDIVTEPIEPVPHGSSTEVFTLVGRWTHDPQSGQTLFTLSWDSSGDPNGLAHFDSKVLSAVLAFGPALLAGIDPDPDDDDGGNQASVSIIALAAAGVLASQLVSDGTVVLNGIEYQVMPLEGGPIQRLVVDYSVEIGFDTKLLEGIGVNISTDAEHPMRVRYRNVGLEFDLSGNKIWYDTLRLVYDDVSFEIEDPGSWVIDGLLGEVLRVVATRAGSGSTWVEVDIEFLVDLGVVTISKATVRVTLDDDGSWSVALRGITVDVDVPGTLTGSGSLAIGPGGVFQAGIDVTVEPAQLNVGAALAFDPVTNYFFLEVKAILPVGIPLGPSGLGLYGFVGRFVVNGTRDIRMSEPDLVARELGWYRTPPQQKYRPEPGQWALGLGAVVGTALDTGFTFNALGMFVVSFPDPSVIFSIEAKFLSSPSTPTDAPEDDDGGGGASGAIIGLAVIDSEAVVIALDGQYSLPDVIDLRVPVSAYFPGLAMDTYVRIGADGFENRAGDPVTATLLPTTLAAKVWSYLMVEGGRLPNLGGDPRFTFEGFCVGFGAGWSVEWDAGPVSLRASAKVLVGLGTKPFMLVGGIFVEGELSVAFVSIGASADLVITLQDRNVSIEGELRATLDLGFFERDVRVPFSIGPSVSEDAPPPPPPLLKVSLTDRNGFAIQQMDAGRTAADAPVWPDTVPVLEFAHPLACALPDDSAFDPGPAPAGPEWSGTSKLKYAYRLNGVQLETGGVALGGALDSAWWWSTFRTGIVAEGDLPLSAEEGRWLALLTWDPRGWSRLLGPDNTDSPGDPSTTVSRLCDPALLPTRACAFGIDAVRVDTSHVEIRDDSSTSTLPSRFAWRAREHLGLIDLPDAVAIASRRGWALQPGRTIPLPPLVALPELPDDASGVYEVATLTDFLGPLMTMQLSGAYEPALVDAQLTLLVLPWERDPIAGVVFCIDFSNASSVEFATDGFEFKGLHFVDLGTDGLRLTESNPPANVPELEFSSEGVRVEFPLPVRGIRVDVRSDSSAILATATNDTGDVVDTAVCPGGRRRTLTLQSDDLIRAVTLTGDNNEAVLISICFVDPLLPTHDDVPDVPPEEQAFPIVFGTRLDGPKVRWIPTVATTVDIGGIECSVVRYDPPRAGRTWVGSEIWPWLGGRIGVISTCGVSTVAQQIADDQAEYVATLVESLNESSAGDAPERRNLLAADTDYTLRVSWEYQAWIAGEDESEPPQTDPDGWTPGPDDITWDFATAPAATEEQLLDALDIRNESFFDPRAISRYIIGFDPADGDATTHFRDDPILAYFSVDHVEQLLALYDREFSFTIQRTDPPPGSAARYGPVGMSPNYGALPIAMMNPADARFVEAAAALPCVDLPAMGGTTAALGGDVLLEPRAHYDLRLAATSTTIGVADITVSVTNFQASRYASPADLLAALGFSPAPTDVPSPVLPYDAIVATEPPRGAASFVTGDAAFDATLADLGLDPWPLAVRPRVVALWRPAGAEWSFEGLLIEADEAIVRPGRLAIYTISVGPAAGPAIALDVVRLSTSSARILATPAASASLAAEEVLTVALASTTTGADGVSSTVTVTGHRRIIDRPRLAYQELT